MKLNQFLITIWLLAAGLASPMTDVAQRRIPAHTSSSWQDDLTDYLNTIDLTSSYESTTVVSFRLDKHNRIQDVVVLAKDAALIRSIKWCLTDRRMYHPCPVIRDEQGNERCVVRLRFDSQS